MTKFFISRPARADMIGIYQYSLVQFGEVQAEQYLGGLDRRFHEIATGNASSRSVDVAHAGVRRALYKEHSIYFRQENSTFTVLRILHQRMDPGRHL